MLELVARFYAVVWVGTVMYTVQQCCGDAPDRLTWAKNWGFACEHVVALDVVTADAELIRADSHQNTDLFWASKGAGPAFPGIVTRFHIQTRPSPVTMLSSGYVYPISRYTDAFPWIVKVRP